MFHSYRSNFCLTVLGVNYPVHYVPPCALNVFGVTHLQMSPRHFKVEACNRIRLVFCINNADCFPLVLCSQGLLFACFAVVAPPNILSSEFSITSFHTCYRGYSDLGTPRHGVADERNRIVYKYSKVRFPDSTFADSRTLNPPKPQ